MIPAGVVAKSRDLGIDFGEVKGFGYESHQGDFATRMCKVRCFCIQTPAVDCAFILYERCLSMEVGIATVFFRFVVLANRYTWIVTACSPCCCIWTRNSRNCLV
jgi:hypothetical protein